MMLSRKGSKLGREPGFSPERGGPGNFDLKLCSRYLKRRERHWSYLQMRLFLIFIYSTNYRCLHGFPAISILGISYTPSSPITLLFPILTRAIRSSTNPNIAHRLLPVSRTPATRLSACDSSGEWQYKSVQAKRHIFPIVTITSSTTQLKLKNTFSPVLILYP